AANLAVVNRIDSPTYSCALHVSFDGGARWQATTVPFPAGEQLPARCYAPGVAFASNGTMYMDFVTLYGIGNSPHAVWLSTSHDGGRTLSTPVKVAGPLAFQVSMAVDPSNPSHLYMAWLHATQTGELLFPNVGNPIVASRSTNGGRTWSKPVQVNLPSRVRVVAPSVAVGAGGRLLVSYLDMGNDALDYNGGSGGMGGPPYPGPWSLVLAYSNDQGTHWGETVIDSKVVPYTRFVVFLPPVPSVSVDRALHRVYVAFTDAALGDPDVYVWASDNNGASFGAGVRVNDTRRHDASAQYLPKLAVAPDGRLDVLYYDRRTDPANLLDAVSLQSSYDGGHTFAPHLVVSDRSFSSQVAPNSSANLPDLGSTLALVSTDTGAVAVWPDTREGTILSGKQDLGSQVISITTPSAWRTPLEALGWVLEGLGLAALVVTGVLWRRRDRPEPSTDGSLAT
ncbi:MAG: sialidase family protein, partial [Acidimicrobiales bacterium]